MPNSEIGQSPEGSSGEEHKFSLRGFFKGLSGEGRREAMADQDSLEELQDKRAKSQAELDALNAANATQLKEANEWASADKLERPAVMPANLGEVGSLEAAAAAKKAAEASPEQSAVEQRDAA